MQYLLFSFTLLFLLATSLSYSQNFYDHNTGNITVSIFDDGWIGHGASVGNGVIFEDNVDACFSAGILYGDPLLGAVGMIGSGGSIQDMSNIAPFSFDSSVNFNQISTFQMSDLTFFNMRVTQTTYSNVGDDFIFIKYLFQNSSGNNYTDLYLGIFCDWDVGGEINFILNRGGIDQSRNLIYQWENGGAIDSNYYGIVAFYGLDGGTTDDHLPPTRIDVYNTMTAITAPLVMDLDHRTIVGDGPYNLVNGESLIVGFGIVAGNNLADLQSNADLAQSIWVSNVVSVDEKSDIPIYFNLTQNFPNPFNPSTTIKFSLTSSGYATLKIYNALGSEIEVLMDNEMNAGTYDVQWNARNYPSGVYFYQLRSGRFVETKKMILMK
jgi:hypothetical protein